MSAIVRVTDDARAKVRAAVTDLESRCALARPTHTGSAATRRLRALLDRVSAQVCTFFVCTRADLLSGEPRRVLDLSPVQAVFVDRIVIPSIIASSRTVWGDDHGQARVDLRGTSERAQR